jgi:hypothetical protein
MAKKNSSVDRVEQQQSQFSGAHSSSASQQHTPLPEQPTLSSSVSSSRAPTIFLSILGILLLAFLIFIAYFSTQQQSAIQFTYNGFDFKKVDYGYQLTLYINQANYPALVKVRNKPQDLEDIPLDEVSFLTKKKQIFVTLDPLNKNLTGKTTIAALEIDSFLDNPYLYNIPVNSSFTQPYAGAPLKTCADVSDTDGVIDFDLGNTTAVSVVDGCVLIRGKTEDDLIRAADRLILTLLGVMER